jgi:formylglycine-generating enzyme required for sulfatase activity
MGVAAGEDPLARPHERPAHRIELDPFFLSRYEFTQGQWDRLVRQWHTMDAFQRNRSYYSIANDYLACSPRPGAHPAEQLNWSQARDLLHALGLELPTEAQWEYAARGGTRKPWGRHDAPGKVRANLADRAYAAACPGSRPDPLLPPDGHGVHAPVGTFPPNPFGLHDMVGNVREICLDRDPDYRFTWQKGTGLRDAIERRSCVTRGGAFNTPARRARVSARNFDGAASSSLGFRAARPLD